MSELTTGDMFVEAANLLGGRRDFIVIISDTEFVRCTINDNNQLTMNCCILSDISRQNLQRPEWWTKVL